MKLVISLALIATIAKSNAFAPRRHTTTRSRQFPAVGIRQLKETSLSLATEVSPVTEPENFKFESNVSRVMDIIINSLYSNKDVFVRELVRIMKQSY